MHIILGLLTVIGVIAVVIYRIRMAADATREIGQAASDVKGAYRRLEWKNKSRVDVIRDIEDPRLAGTAMMVAVAKADGDLTSAQIRAVRDAMTGTFRMDDAAADEMLAESRWLSNDLGDLGSFLRRLSPAVQKACTDEEKSDLIDVLTRIAAIEGPVSDIQQNAIGVVERETGLN